MFIKLMVGVLSDDGPLDHNFREFRDFMPVAVSG